MTKYQMTSSWSPTRTLAVDIYPTLQIMSVVWVTSPQAAGTPLTIAFTFKNNGGDGKYLNKIVDNVTGAIYAIDTTGYSIAAGETVSTSFPVTMPAKDVVFKLQLTDAQSGAVQAEATSPLIEQLVAVATTLTLTLNKTEARPGESVVASGKLSRVDVVATGAQSIQIRHDVSGQVLVTLTSDGAGNYSGSFNAPSTAGSHPIVAYFAGSGILAASTSGDNLLGVVGASPLVWLGLAAAVLYIFRKDLGIKI